MHRVGIICKWRRRTGNSKRLEFRIVRVGFITSMLGVAFVALESSERPTAAPSEFEGFVEAYRMIQLSSPADGIIEKMAVDRGDAVRKGQVVAVLESSVERATLEIAQARTEMEGDLNAQKARLKYSLEKFAKDEELHQQGILSADEFKQRTTEKLLAEAALLKTEDDLRVATLEKKRAEAALELRTIRSPIDGIVIERYLSPGELVTRLTQARIVSIAEIDPLRVEVMLPAAMMGKVSPGRKALVVADGLLDKEFEAEVKITDPVVDAASGTFRVRLEITEGQSGLAPGLKCRVSFHP